MGISQSISNYLRTPEPVIEETPTPKTVRFTEEFVRDDFAGNDSPPSTRTVRFRGKVNRDESESTKNDSPPGAKSVRFSEDKDTTVLEEAHRLNESNGKDKKFCSAIVPRKTIEGQIMDAYAQTSPDFIRGIAARVDPFIHWTMKELGSVRTPSSEKRSSTEARPTIQLTSSMDVFRPPKWAKGIVKAFTTDRTRPAFRNEERFPDALIVTRNWVLNSDLGEFEKVLREKNSTGEYVRLGKNQTVVHVLCENIMTRGVHERLEVALKAGEDPNMIDDANGFSARTVILKGNTDEVIFRTLDLLLEYGLNINLLDYPTCPKQAHTILGTAFAIRSDLSVIEYLLKKGVNSDNVYQKNSFNTGPYRDAVIKLCKKYRKQTLDK
jgi:hypothetical protein